MSGCREAIILSFVYSCVSAGYSSLDGYISALGDVNSDKSIDVIALSYSTSGSVDVNLGLWNSGKSQYDATTVFSCNNTVTGTNLADFDSDGQVDLFFQSRDSTWCNTSVLWGHGNGFSSLYSFRNLMCSQPLVADFNGDEIPDVMAKECSNNTLKVWISNGWKRTFSMYPIDHYVETECLNLATISQSNLSLAFIDINQDLMADLIIVSHTDTSVTVTPLIRSSSDNKFHCCKPVNMNSSIPPNPSFADFNADGLIDILFPACSLSNCTDATIRILFNNRSGGCPEFQNFDINLRQVTGEKYTVDLRPISIPIPNKPEVLIPTWIRVGDYNLDTYPDIVIVATIKEDSIEDSQQKYKYKGFLLINSDCSSSHNCGHGRTLEQHYNKEFDSYYGDIRLGLFHDIDEDGDLDILLNVVNKRANAQLVIGINGLDSDSNFLRVDILTAACIGKTNCNEDPAYGVSQLGAMAGFATTGPHGNEIQSISGQVSKSGSFSCSLPYVIFGLSRSSNFVEHLEVGIPYVERKGLAMRRWSSIIPNSHLYIVPQPSNDPSNWKNILLLNPSDKVWYTLAVFASTCAVFGVIVGLLQWREKRQDEREKRQQAHKFHFDAM